MNTHRILLVMTVDKYVKDPYSISIQKSRFKFLAASVEETYELTFMYQALVSQMYRPPVICTTLALKYR